MLKSLTKCLKMAHNRNLYQILLEHNNNFVQSCIFFLKMDIQEKGVIEYVEKSKHSKGRGGLANPYMADKGGGGVREMLKLADKGGRGVWTLPFWET